MRQPFPKLLVLALSLLFSSAVAQAEEPGKQAEKDTANQSTSATIYERIGGTAAIDAAVDRFYEKILADDRVNHFFEDVNMSRQIAKQKAFLAAAFGGPVPYEGKDLRQAHATLDLTDQDFDAIAEHLHSTLTELKVDGKLVSEVMTLLESTRAAVLNRPETTQVSGE
tara:strand:- start:9125 stop:9628 length:504 start_codon:yes stop_codon:yes gene_type:complete